MRDFLWSSSFLILAICLMRRLFAGKMPMKHLYSLWLVAALGLCILPFSAHMPGSMFSILNLAELLEEEMEEGAEYIDGVPGDTDGNGQSLEAKKSAEALPEGAGKGQIEDAENGGKSQRAPGRGTFIAEQRALLLAVWAAGAAAMSGWMLWVNGKLKKEMLQKRVPLGKKSSIQLSEKWLNLPVYLVEDLGSPCLLSIKGEKGVYIPDRLLLEPESLRHAAAHEICHWKQGDLFWNGLRCTILAVYWFHPLVWAAAWLSRQDCELSCDEAAVRLLGREERFAYGRTLLSLVGETEGKSRMLCSGTWMTAGGKQMQYRISRLAKGTKMTLGSVLGFYMLLCLTTSASICQPMREKAETAEGEELFSSLGEEEITAGDIQPLGSGADSAENAALEAQLAGFLTKNHLLYVGDAVGSGRIVGACIRSIGLTSAGSTELQTSREPYGYRLIFKEEDRENLDEEKIKAVSILAFASIENLGVLEVYTGPDGIQKGEQFLEISRQEAMEAYGLQELQEYGESQEKMLELVQEVSVKVQESGSRTMRIR